MDAEGAMNTPEPPASRLWLWLLVATAAAGLFHTGLYLFPFEDAYISFRYAENFANGHGFVFNPGGESVEGFTSFLWVLLLGVLNVFGAAVPDTAVALSLCLGLGLLGVSAALAAYWNGRVDAWIVLPPAVLAANGTWAYWSGSGMETTLFVFLLGLAVLSASKTSGRMALAAALCLALLAMVRPEGAGYAIAVTVALLAGRSSRKQGVRILCLFALFFVPWFLWRWHHFGYPLPNTVYVKASPSSEQLYYGWRYLEECLTSHGYWLVLPALGWALSRQKWGLKARLFAFVLGANAVNVVVVGGDIFSFYRFLLPAQVLGGVVLIDGCRRLTRGVPRLPERARGGLAVGLCLLLGVWMLWAGWLPRYSLHGATPESHRARVLNVDKMNREYQVIGEWLSTTFPSDAVVALNAAGIVPHASGLASIDMLGLNDTHIAHVVVSGDGALGHQKHDADYVLSREPTVVVLGLPELTANPIPGERLIQWFGRWWPHLPGDKAMWMHERFQAEYQPHSVRIGAEGWFTFFVRRGSEPVL